MKKYVKPDIFYESFELSQNIAVCGWDMSNLKDKNSCVAIGDETEGNYPVRLFTDAPRCEATEDKVEHYCYETGSGSMAIFNS